MSTPAQIDADELLGRLSHAEAEQARAVAAAPASRRKGGQSHDWTIAGVDTNDREVLGLGVSIATQMRVGISLPTAAGQLGVSAEMAQDAVVAYANKLLEMVTAEVDTTHWNNLLGLAPAICDRFWSTVDASGDCWIWLGTPSVGQYGDYGKFFINNRMHYAHRLAYEMLVGPIPDDLTIDHLCRNTMCVNPDHLEPVTAEENTRRNFSPSAVTLRHGRCRRGHSMIDAYIAHRSNGTVSRRCRPCALELERKKHQPEPPAQCVFCWEAAGWCDATGGPNLCEGHDEHVLAVADAIAAPEIWWRPAQPGETPGQLTPEAEAQR